MIALPEPDTTGASHRARQTQEGGGETDSGWLADDDLRAAHAGQAQRNACMARVSAKPTSGCAAQYWTLRSGRVGEYRTRRSRGVGR